MGKAAFHTTRLLSQEAAFLKGWRGHLQLRHSLAQTQHRSQPGNGQHRMSPLETTSCNLAFHRQGN